MDVTGEGESRTGQPSTRTSDEVERHVAGRGRGRLGLDNNDPSHARRRSPSLDRPRPAAGSGSAPAIRGPTTLAPRTDNPPRPRVTSPATQRWLLASEENMYSWAEARTSDREAQLHATMEEAHAHAEHVYHRQFREAAAAYESQYAHLAAEVERRNQNQLSQILGEMRTMQTRTFSLHEECGRAFRGEAMLQQELQGVLQSRQSDLDRTRGEASAMHEATLHARAVAEQENAAMQRARLVAEHEAAATQHARNVAQREANAAQSEASQASALMQQSEQARWEQAEKEARSAIEFVTLRRELERYEAREQERISESAARRSASPRRQNLEVPSEERVGNFRIYTPSHTPHLQHVPPVERFKVRSQCCLNQSSVTSFSKMDMMRWALTTGLDHNMFTRGEPSEARGSNDPTLPVPITNPWLGTPFQTLREQRPFEQPRADTSGEAERHVAEVPTFGIPPGLPRNPAAKAKATPAPPQEAPRSTPVEVSAGETPFPTGQTTSAQPTNMTPGGVPQYVKATEASSVNIPSVPTELQPWISWKRTVRDNVMAASGVPVSCFSWFNFVEDTRRDVRTTR